MIDRGLLVVHNVNGRRSRPLPVGCAVEVGGPDHKGGADDELQRA